MGARDPTLLAVDQECDPGRGGAQEETNASDAPKASSRAITINLITGGLGSAIFSLPWSLAGSSIIPGMIITAAVLVLNGWTISILVRAAEKYQVFDIGSVISHLPGGLGKPLQVITNVFVWFSMFLCLVSYIIVIHDSAEHFLSPGGEADTGQSRLMLVSLASLVVLPLCFLKMSWLEKTSSIAVFINIYLFIIVGVFYFTREGKDLESKGCCVLGWTIRGNFAMMTVMFQAVIIQMCVLPMYKELEDRSPAKFNRIVAVGFSVLFVLFCGFSTLAYLLIGPTVADDVLSGKNHKDALPINRWSDIAKVGVIFVVSCVYPIMVYPMIAPLEAADFMSGARKKTSIVLAKFLIVIGALLVAWQVESLGTINVVNGAMSAGIFVALVPSSIGLLMLDVGPAHKVALYCLLFGGLGVSGCGFVFNDNYVDDLKCSISV